VKKLAILKRKTPKKKEASSGYRVLEESPKKFSIKQPARPKKRTVVVYSRTGNRKPEKTQDETPKENKRVNKKREKKKDKRKVSLRTKRYIEG